MISAVLLSLNVPVAVNCFVLPRGILTAAGVVAMDFSVTIGGPLPIGALLPPHPANQPTRSRVQPAPVLQTIDLAVETMTRPQLPTSPFAGSSLILGLTEIFAAPQSPPVVEDRSGSVDASLIGPRSARPPGPPPPQGWDTFPAQVANPVSSLTYLRFRPNANSHNDRFVWLEDAHITWLHRFLFHRSTPKLVCIRILPPSHEKANCSGIVLTRSTYNALAPFT